MSETEATKLKGGQFSDFIARLTMKALLALFAVFLFATTKLIREGMAVERLFLVAGSLLSAIVMIGYSFLVLVPKGRRSLLLGLAAFSGFVPYGFGIYLVFYRGFWRLKDLFDRFTIGVLFEALCFIVVGYAIVSGIDKVTEFVRAVNNGDIAVE